MELERLTTVKEELTEEVARLHKLLEQERSSMKANSANVNGISDTHNAKHKDKVIENRFRLLVRFSVGDLNVTAFFLLKKNKLNQFQFFRNVF